MERILFYILASIIISSAMASVISRRMLRSVIYLLFVLGAIAGLYFLIDYNFLAAIQLTIYAGGIIVLIIFSVLLVHHIEMRLEIAKPSRQLIAGVVSSIGLGLFLFTIYSYDFKVVENSVITEVEEIGLVLLSYGSGGFVLPFEVVSVLLLAVMIGAIVIAKGNEQSENIIK
jgi:NADH-quinone oxidoreductase subunit J